MSLLDEARESSRVRYPVCGVATLDEDLRDELEEALAEDGITAAGVERALAKRGVQIKASTLRRHGRGDCSC